MSHALRKSVGPFSAGTRVNILQDNRDGSMHVEILVPEPEGTKQDSYDYEDMVVDIDKSLLVELRSREGFIHKTGRKERRAFLTQLFAAKTQEQ